MEHPYDGIPNGTLNGIQPEKESSMLDGTPVEHPSDGTPNGTPSDEESGSWMEHPWRIGEERLEEAFRRCDG